MEKALALTLEWTAIERQGYVVWPQERSGAAGTAIGGGTEEREVNASDVTLEDAVKIYIAEQESRVLAARVSDRHAEACRHRLSRMLAFMGPKRRVCDIGQDDLMRLVNHFVSRPNALDANGRDFDPPRPIAIATVAMLVKAAKYFFEWLSEHDAIEWEKPKRFRQIFRIDRGGMLTEAERERRYSEVVSREVRHFSMDDLGRLYKIADGRATSTKSTVEQRPLGSCGTTSTPPSKASDTPSASPPAAPSSNASSPSTTNAKPKKSPRVCTRRRKRR